MLLYELFVFGFSYFSRCRVVGGEEVLNRFLKQQEELVYCFMQQFDMDILEKEINTNRRSGDLDLVFDKYCGSVDFTFLTH